MTSSEESSSYYDEIEEEFLVCAEEMFGYKQCQYFKDENEDGDNVLHDHEGKPKRRCHCGEYEESHPRSVESDSAPWDKSFLKLVFPTNAYGTISYGNTRYTEGVSSFVRLANVHDKADILKYLETECDILDGELPNMCIVMADIGDRMQLPEGKLKLLEGYLYNLAITTEIIFISSGLNTPISNLTGRICQRASEFRQAESGYYPDKYRSIGIMPWSKVKSSNVLETKGEVVYTVSEDDESTEQYELCSAYRHFIMVDDGYRRGRVGDEFESYAAGICEAIRASPLEGGWGLPVILVVAGGDYEVFRSVLAYTELGLPVVVIRNNCGAPNALWEFYTLCGESRKNSNHVMKNNSEDIKDFLVKIFFLRENETLLDEMVYICSRIAESWDLIKFVSLKMESDLDIIQSITVETAADVIGAVKLAVKLGRTDLARERLSLVRHLPYAWEMDKLLTDLLLEENVEFIDVLLTFNLSMERYLTIEALQQLYRKSSNNDLLRLCLKVYHIKVKRAEQPKLDGSNGDGANEFNDPPRVKANLCLYHINELLKKLTGKFHSHYYELTREASSDELNERTFQGPFQELFLWAILRQRQKLALFLWRKCEEGVFLAVFASCLSRRIARVIPSHERQRKLQVLANADEFEDLAVTMISSCANVYPNITWTIPTFTKVSWNCADTEWLGLIGRCRRFMGTREMQDYIYFKWTNDVSARTLPVSAGLLFPPLFALSYFSTEKNEAMTREQIEKEGIDDSQIQAYIGDDCYLVEKQLSVKEIIAQTYMSPRAKFMLRFIIYLPFLFFATNTILYEMPRLRYTLSELFLAITLFIQVLDAGFPFVDLARKCGKHHFDFFLSLPFVWLETAIALQLLICLFLRLFLKYNFYLMKSFAAILLLTLYCRLFLFIRASRRLGPALMTLYAMIKVALIFFIIILVILLPSGISQEALLFPSETLFTLDTVYKILFFDFYRLFGELNLERAHGEQEGCPTNDTTVDCPVYNAFVPIILACYMLIANIFLVNFLIAIFNNVIEEVQAEALGRWKYNLLLETEQYACRYILPPPLTLFEMIYHSCKAIFCKQLRSPKTDRATEAKVKSESEEAGKDTEISVGDDEENTNEHLVARELTLSESQEARMQANQAVLNLALIETQKAEQEAERQMEMTRVTKLQQIVEDVLNEAEDSLAALTVPEETVKPEPSTRGLPVKKDEDEEAPPSVEEVQQLLVEFEKQVQALVSLMDRRLWEFIKRSEHTSGENII
uniref:Uncharacterized protein n=1 Tax=Schistocephalus solidus TaxID=70667 RepID=A0A0X3NZ02_SCHSO